MESRGQVDEHAEVSVQTEGIEDSSFLDGYEDLLNDLDVVEEEINLLFL